MRWIYLFLSLLHYQRACGQGTIVFSHGESGYYCIRIPSLLRTFRGTLIAFGEGRMSNCNDNTRIDIVFKRSLDDGQTWSSLQVLVRANESSSTNEDFVGNPTAVQLRFKERILVLFCKNTQILLQTYSDDEGITFSKPETILNVTKLNWDWVVLGPPSGLLLQSDRILIPGYHSIRTQQGVSYYSIGFVMLNDYNGSCDRWYLGGEYSLQNFYPNEGQAVELLPSQNHIFINARSIGTQRIGAYSDDGGITFSRVVLLNNLVQPSYGCEGSTIYDTDSHRIFYSGLAETSTKRTNLSMYTSDDNGNYWTLAKLVEPGPSGYSSLAMMNNQSIGILYEKGTFIGSPAYLIFEMIRL